MKIKNVTKKVIFRKVGKDMKSFEPDEVVEVHDSFALSSGLEVSEKRVKAVSKASKSKKTSKPKEEKRSLKDKVFDLLDDGKLNHSNKKRK